METDASTLVVNIEVQATSSTEILLVTQNCPSSKLAHVITCRQAGMDPHACSSRRLLYASFKLHLSSNCFCSPGVHVSCKLLAWLQDGC